MIPDDILKNFGKGIHNSIIESIPTPFSYKMPELIIPENPNHASEFHKRLIEWINDFDKSLDASHEVGLRLVSFGQALTFHLEDIGYWNPSLISFKGHNDQGEPVELIQHVTQISILLLKMERQDTSKPKKPIGFVQENEEEE